MYGNQDASNLVKGNTLHQIFSNPKYIFKVSSTLEKLYIYEVDPTTNDVVKIRVYRRVSNEDSAMMNLQNTNLKKISGTATPYKGTRYKVYSNKHFSGYIFLDRSVSRVIQTSSSEIICYKFEAFKNKGR